MHGRHEAELPTLQPMRTVFVFPTGERAETVASLDQHLPEQRNPWTLDGNLYIDIDDEQTGHLFSDWDPADVAILDAAIGHHPTWAVQIDISGRIDGTAEVQQMIALLLEHGGVATDDYTPPPMGPAGNPVWSSDRRPALLRLSRLPRTQPRTRAFLTRSPHQP
ncbi:hypothetical protein GCM10022232_93910 [Streptomyces plumbiresistens]|uniref:Uncharacterized protein n=2 Tax=Streptomyces TaxID=1883 RepID=A0ABP7TZC2_9ACTN